MVVLPVGLSIFWVFLFNKVVRHMFYLFGFSIFPYGPLLFLQSVLLTRCQLHVSILKSPLIRSATSVGRRNHLFQEFREVVQLEHVLTETIHLFPLFRVRSLSPNDFSLLRLLRVDNNNLAIPITVNIEYDLPFAIEYLAIYFKSSSTSPTSSVIFQNALFALLGAITNH